MAKRFLSDKEENIILKRIKEFFHRETVLLVSMILAFISCIFVTPSKDYVNYIDFRVLALLFCLMMVVAGMREIGIFTSLGIMMTHNVKTYRGMTFVFVILCFFSSMLITNDVALITFVPFTLVILEKTEDKTQMIRLIVLETIAANLGSMLTPIGNPQNLYVYSAGNMEFGEFILCMLPLAIVSFVILLLLSVVTKRVPLPGDLQEENIKTNILKDYHFWIYLLLFLLCVLNVFHIVNYVVVFLIVIVLMVMVRPKLFLTVDYSLLATFVFFFIFVGNMKSMDSINSLLLQVVEGREYICGILISQVISNVPATMLLAGFTDRYHQLLWGVNTGGLGTIIASMASLISYKFYTATTNANQKKYMLSFTAYNLLFLFILILAAVCFLG